MIPNLSREIIPFLTIRSLPIYLGSFKQILGKEKGEGKNKWENHVNSGREPKNTISKRNHCFGSSRLGEYQIDLK